VEASDIEVTENLIPFSRSNRVGTPNFIYTRNRRDNDWKARVAAIPLWKGGVAASWFGSEADFSRLLVKTPPIALSFGITARDRLRLARSTTVGVENPLGSTVLLDPAQTPTAAETLIPLPERFIRRGNSNRRIRVNQAGPPRSLHGVSRRRQRFVPQ